MSGPKRYDYVATTTPTPDNDKNVRSGKDEDAVGDKGKDKRKAEQGSCNWIYLRDGTSLTELLREELGVDIEVKYEHGKGE